VILLYPLLLIGALVTAVRQKREGGRGWRWFGVWCAAGALFTFSLVTGLSIGLFLFPAVAVALLFVARKAPHAEESAGFIAGAGLVILIVAALRGGETAIRWPAGLVPVLGASAAYAVWRRRARAS
jgi:hypothetical protein